MQTDEEVEYLKIGYERLKSTEPLVIFGPLEIDYGPDEAWSRDFFRSVSEIIERIKDNQEKSEQGRYHIQVPSPWHAYFYLRDLQLQLYTRELGEHLFFRGQRCSGWDFNSSISRCKDTDQKKKCERLTLCLQNMFHEMNDQWPDLAKITGQCFAQHYGIPTELIDISCDPDVAIWFASRPDEPCNPSTTQAVVRVISWGGQSRGTPTACYLPPPFVRNLYRQHALFLDSSTTNGNMISTLQYDIFFPHNSKSADFQVYRNGAPFEIYNMGGDQNKVGPKWYEDIPKDCSDRRLFMELKRFIPLMRLPPDWITEWISSLDWVLPATCITAAHIPNQSTPMRYEINSLKVEQLVACNHDFFHALIDAIDPLTFKYSSYHEAFFKSVNEYL